MNAVSVEGTKFNKGLLFVMLMATALMMLGVSRPAFQVMALGLICLAILFSEKTEILCILAYAGPFALVFKLSPGGFAFINFVLLAATAKLVLFSRDKFSISFRQGLWVSLLLAAAVGSIVSSTVPDMDDALLLIVMLILILAFSKDPEKIDLHSVLIFFSVSVIATSVLGLFVESIPNLESYIVYDTLRDGGTYNDLSRFGGLRGNPNHYTIDVSIALAGLMAYNMCVKFRKFDVLLIGVLIVFGVMSVSKSFIVSLAVLLFIVIFFQRNSNLKKSITSTLVLLVLLIVMYFLIKDTDYFIAAIGRFQGDSESSLSEITTGRTDIWLKYFELFKEDIKVFLIGAGINSPGYLRATHNFFLDVVYRMGIIGTFFYYKAIRNAIPFLPRKPINKACYAVWLTFFIRAMAASMFEKEELFFYFVLSSLMVYKCVEKEMIEELTENGGVEPYEEGVTYGN